MRTRGAIRVGMIVTSLTLAGGAPEARGQGWSVDVSAGQTVFDAVAANVGTQNLMAGLRYDARRGGWVYGAGAVPLRSQDPFWGAFGTGGRVTLVGSASGRASFGLDVGGHGFLFRDAVSELGGTGGTIEAMPVVSVRAGAARVDARAGWRGHALSYSNAVQYRGAVEAATRVTYGRTLQVAADTRWIRTPEGSFPFAGGALTYAGTPVQMWAYAGRWLGSQLDDVAWGTGSAYVVNPRLSLWAQVRQEAPDPLYWNTVRRTWSTGLTTRFGRSPAAVLAPAPVSPGHVTIRLPVGAAPTSELWIAGTFNAWQPERMHREGGDWVFRTMIRRGSHRYAFRTGDGTWFVPASVAGRRDDGMGGHVAILVVE
jgi:hypothetical protein